MTTNFKEFALEPTLQSSLDAMSFETPTPIQAAAIPLALEGRDLLGSAQTGTGKTAAFCVPMINYLIKNHTAHALVMLPTRELATQVHDVARKMMSMEKGIKTALLIGGEPIGKQYVQLNRRPRLIVGTPGRINDHLRGNPDLVDRVSFVVLDEADRMLDMGFAPQIDSILSETAMERQTLMFSATFPDNIVKFSKQYLQNPERISVGSQSKPGENIIQENMDVDQSRKYDELLLQLEKREGSVIVFVRTQHSADKIAQRLSNDEHAAEAIHGGLRQRQREKVISQFRRNDIRVLVATDVAARGLDVPHIEHVVNYDLPQVAEDYIHRIGRTARAGNKGHAISFISSGERHLWRDIDRMMNPDAKGAYESTMREGGAKKSGGGKFGYGKKSFGQKPFGKKPFEKKFDGERSGGGFKERKPFGRADRKDRNEGGWNPANDFQRNDGGNEQRGERNYANNPDSYKRTTSTEGRSFKKPFNGDRPFRKEGGNNEGRSFKPRSEGGYNDRPRSEGGERSYKPRSEGGYNDRPRSNNGDRPYRSDKPRSEGGYDRPRGNNGDRPFRKDGASQGGQRDGGFKPRTEGGFKKPYNKDGAGRSEGGFKKPYAAKDGAKRSEGGFKKPFNRDGKKEGGEKRSAPAGRGRY